MQFKKGIFCAAALTLLSGIAGILTGCSDGRMLSDKALADVLSKSLGQPVEITQAPEKKSNGSYSMKCADGTEFTVERMWKRHKMFGPIYYDYECDYLVNWVNDHPELNAMLDERGISYLDGGRGIRVIASNFDEVHAVVETVCALVEDDSNYIRAVSDFSGEYDLRFLHPFILGASLKTSPFAFLRKAKGLYVGLRPTPPTSKNIVFRGSLGRVIERKK